MRFVVYPTAMNGPESVLNELDAILLRVENDVHEMEVPPADQLEQSPWYQSSRPDRRKTLQQIATQSLYRGNRTKGPHLRHTDVQDAASAIRAKNLAHSPLRVLVENDDSDRALVAAALTKFASAATVKLCFGAPSKLAPAAFEVESRGGHGNLPTLISKRLAEAASQGCPPRLVVVTDSDGEWVGDVKPYAQKIRNQCAQAAIPCPPLHKRNAENYIPDAVWRAWSAEREHTSARPAVDALLKLSREQRDHVRIEKTDTPPWDPKVTAAASLFVTVSDPDRDLLTKASLKGKAEKRMILALQQYEQAFTAADLSARDHQGDLKQLVRHIEDEL